MVASGSSLFRSSLTFTGLFSLWETPSSSLILSNVAQMLGIVSSKSSIYLQDERKLISKHMMFKTDA